MYRIGNVVVKVLKLVYGRCFFDPTTEDVVSVPAVEVPALVIDLSHFETTSQVPEGLSKKVVASKRVQAEWYRKLLEAWKDATPPPKTREEAARLVISRPWRGINIALGTLVKLSFKNKGQARPLQKAPVD
ncbi:hypothetical protein SLEP1_g13752 [Rubroshorea leprosula]|uniref:Uncharacterized protein n=1 Tax=Rubroshorea leprosula TaxID=152421 RepID=A0AAV5IRJ5_9ROSI|nr:hypothetical protein SLEP1_g13752 [Rubroshorea leprosula]